MYFSDACIEAGSYINDNLAHLDAQSFKDEQVMNYYTDGTNGIFKKIGRLNSDIRATSSSRPVIIPEVDQETYRNYHMNKEMMR